jgi:hypothetical protein
VKGYCLAKPHWVTSSLLKRQHSSFVIHLKIFFDKFSDNGFRISLFNKLIIPKKVKTSYICFSVYLDSFQMLARVKKLTLEEVLHKLGMDAYLA